MRELADISWGLLGPETLAGERRSRTLGLGSVVRSFNDLAVPGLGGVWFGKQLFLAILGVAIAENIKGSGKPVQNIVVSNAVEALACWLAFNNNSRRHDPRLRGLRKMQGKTDLSFAAVRKPNFYVTQPMRQATVQVLRALGLVESQGERFNAFSCTPSGHAFIKAVCTDRKPHGRSVLDHLTRWVRGDHDKVRDSSPLLEALSPIEPMSEQAREFLRELMVQPTGIAAARRLAALNWVGEILKRPEQTVAWNAKPKMLDEGHWQDLHAGALFLGTRDAATTLLNKVETEMGNREDARLSLGVPLPVAIANGIESLREHARDFLTRAYDPFPDLLASTFCRECTAPNETRVLEMLVQRDNRVLQLRDGMIVPGAAFRGVQNLAPDIARSPEEEGGETDITQRILFPEGISHRVHNLFLFNLDLCGRLDEWLMSATENNGLPL